MSKPKLKFPHILREKTARLIQPAVFSLRWIALLALLAVNISLLTSWIPHSFPVLGEAVLGASTRQEQQTQRYDHAQDALAYWRGVAAAHPDYKDGHLMVAVFAYQLREDAIAQEAVARVLAIDPGDETALRLRGSLLESGK